MLVVPDQSFYNFMVENPSHDVPRLDEIRQSPFVEALKLRKSLSRNLTDLGVGITGTNLEPQSWKHS